MLGSLRSDAAEFLGLELGDHTLADTVALADLLGIFQADLGVGVFHFLHDFTQQAGTECADFRVNVHDDVLVLDFVILLYGNDDGRLDLVDQVIRRQAALLFQSSESIKEFVVRSSHFYGFLPI